ncbi:hypothetical protein C9374_002913 [Naegleria lovaniensis]|uniref:Dipeptidase n=1 Tax=Naegleria lovaniensis TaxID=51637 RepID=A0AA88KLE8_NAELO|nr:uncharacterized protein C9374_002913 [Naegleria lovaniensis]KAG2385764.1 hypothetical protein C9374_002913 [Naegleria lovaniensis]
MSSPVSDESSSLFSTESLLEDYIGWVMSCFITILCMFLIFFPVSSLFKFCKSSRSSQPTNRNDNDQKDEELEHTTHSHAGFTSVVRSFLIRSVLSCVIFFVALPWAFDTFSNQIYTQPDTLKNTVAMTIHQNIPFIADLHADTLMWKHRGGFLTTEKGHVSLSKMQRGNQALQVFAAVNSIPHTLNMKTNVNSTDILPFLMASQLYDYSAWFSPFQRARAYSKLLHDYQSESKGLFTIIKNKKILEEFVSKRAHNKNLVSGLYSIEGATVLEHQLENVQKLYDMGVRMFGLNHFGDNQVSGSLHGLTKYGLSDFGKQVVRKLSDLKVIIDLAHASEKAMSEVLDMLERGEISTTVMISHTGLKGICNTTRNLSDDFAKRIAKHGGVIGIAFFKYTTCGHGFESVARSIKYLKNLLGGNSVENIALGSDWDGTIKAFGASDHLVHLTDALISQNFTETEISQIMGGNVLKMLRRSLPDY